MIQSAHNMTDPSFCKTAPDRNVSPMWSSRGILKSSTLCLPVDAKQAQIYRHICIQGSSSGNVINANLFHF